MKIFVLILVCALAVAYGQEPPTEEPVTEEPPTEEPPTEAPPPPGTEAPKPKAKCIGKWKQCMRAADSTDAKRECYGGLRGCAVERGCDTSMCDTPQTECMEKASEKQKESLKCEKSWKKCYKDNRKAMCHKKAFDEPPTEEPITEGPPTEEPPTEAPPPPGTEAPKPKAKCIGKWKQCMRAADSTDAKRECYGGLRGCAVERGCDTSMCDTHQSECMEKATEKQKESLKCEKSWKKCYKDNRKAMCHKKAFDEPPTEEPVIPTEEPPTEEPPTEAPPPPGTEAPKPKAKCIGKWKQCMRAADSTDAKRECYGELRGCAVERGCDTSMCDTHQSECMEKASEKQKESLKCEKSWKKCYKKDRKAMCHKKAFDEPPTEEPPTEEPPTEEPETPAPPTKGPKPEKPRCVGKWKKCKAAASSDDEKRECYVGLKTCVQSHCDTSACDQAAEECTTKGGKGLKCFKRWMKCFREKKWKICH